MTENRTEKSNSGPPFLEFGFCPPPLSEISGSAPDEGNTKRLPIQVLEGDGPSLLGRNWLKDIKLNWRTIKKLSNNLDSMLEEHKDVFKDELGTIKGVKAKLFVKPGSSLLR